LLMPPRAIFLIRYADAPPLLCASERRQRYLFTRDVSLASAFASDMITAIFDISFRLRYFFDILFEHFEHHTAAAHDRYRREFSSVMPCYFVRYFHAMLLFYIMSSSVIELRF